MVQEVRYNQAKKLSKVVLAQSRYGQSRSSDRPLRFQMRGASQQAQRRWRCVPLDLRVSALHLTVHVPFDGVSALWQILSTAFEQGTPRRATRWVQRDHYC